MIITKDRVHLALCCLENKADFEAKCSFTDSKSGNLSRSIYV